MSAGGKEHLGKEGSRAQARRQESAEHVCSHLHLLVHRLRLNTLEGSMNECLCKYKESLGIVMVTCF